MIPSPTIFKRLHDSLNRPHRYDRIGDTINFKIQPLTDHETLKKSPAEQVEFS